MSGSTIGGVLGAAVGGWFFGPAGAQWGWMIGSAIGGYVDPEKIEGPRLTDAAQQTSQDGVPIPFGYGTFPTAGNVIWQGPLREIKKKERQGKGGPEVTTYRYLRSYAIGICEGPITGLLIVRRNGQTVYDARSNAELEALGHDAQQISAARAGNAKFLSGCRIYLGDEAQLPDPTIEAVEGVGNVAPFRGLAYIVVKDDDLTDLRGAIPQYEFVVSTCGTVEYFGAGRWMLDSYEDPPPRNKSRLSDNLISWSVAHQRNGQASVQTTYGPVYTGYSILHFMHDGTSYEYSHDFDSASGFDVVSKTLPVLCGHVRTFGAGEVFVTSYRTTNPSSQYAISLNGGLTFQSVVFPGAESGNGIVLDMIQMRGGRYLASVRMTGGEYKIFYSDDCTS